MKTVSVGLSDVGRRRSINEDAMFRDDDLGLYVVADGVGGHSRGEVASRETVEQLEMWMSRCKGEIERLIDLCDSGHRESCWEVRRLLENGIQQACYMVFGMAEIDPSKHGMSTTCSAVLIRGHNAFAAHVGDSRVYRLREGTILQLTEDHTLVNYKVKHGLMAPEDAGAARGKNVITRAVGHKDYVQVDTADIDVAPFDRFLLCTDGLHGYLRGDDEVAEIIAGESLEKNVRAAVALANQRGGRDNITALMIEVVPD
jgi:protein phosphatase